MKIHWYIFHQTELLLERVPDGTYTIPSGKVPPVKLNEDQVCHHLHPDDEDGFVVRTAMTEDEQLVDESSKYEWFGLRQSFYHLPINLYRKAGKCWEILYWDRNTKYCGVCGNAMNMHTEISKRCPKCGNEVWPQVSPAVIVLIRRQKPGSAEHGVPVDEVLLVQARNFRTDFYGLVAGFVETGETLEEAVHREVYEETGIRITNLRYFGSQPWPYPSGVMVGFHADYVSGDIHLQQAELKRGAWFTKDNLPTIPEKLSIARKLIDDWLETDD